MPFTSLATKVYKDPVTVVWCNSIKENESYLFDFMAIKAWLNFDGKAAGITARASFNIASLTDISAGKYEIGFTTHFETNTFTVVGNANTQFTAVNTAVGDSDIFSPYYQLSGSFRIKLESDDGNPRDSENIGFMVIGPYTS